MIPPSWVTKKAEELCSNVRIGWDGAEKHFAIIQLQRWLEPATTKGFIGTPWGKRGPIYGTPFDLFAYCPVYIIGVSVEDVMRGDLLLQKLQRWTRSWADRLREEEEATLQEFRRKRQETAESAADRYCWATNRDPFPGPVVANRHISAEDKAKVSDEHAEATEERLQAMFITEKNP